MPTHQSATSAINLIDEAPRPVEAEALPGNAMDDVVMRVIARVEQTFGAWRLSAADHDRHVSADRLQLAHNMIDGAPQSKLGTSAPIGCISPHGETVGAPQSDRRVMSTMQLYSSRLVVGLQAQSFVGQ